MGAGAEMCRTVSDMRADRETSSRGRCRKIRAMCSRYQSVRLDEDLRKIFKAALSAGAGDLKQDVFPGYTAPFIRRPRERDSGDEAVPDREARVGVFGLLPHWAKDAKLTKSTYNARSETVASKPAFRDAWRTAKHCIIPAWAFYEPDWRTGKHIPTRIARADGRPLGIAGLWSWWKPSGGGEVLSFTMLTINADAHPVMRNYHRPDDEKRMIVILREEDYDAWLDAPPERSMDFMRACPPEDLSAVGETKVA
jgi:putative SOS response-associated peptidase YedK